MRRYARLGQLEPPARRLQRCDEARPRRSQNTGRQAELAQEWLQPGRSRVLGAKGHQPHTRRKSLRRVGTDAPVNEEGNDALRGEHGRVREAPGHELSIRPPTASRNNGPERELSRRGQGGVRLQVCIAGCPCHEARFVQGVEAEPPWPIGRWSTCIRTDNLQVAGSTEPKKGVPGSPPRVMASGRRTDTESPG